MAEHTSNAASLVQAGDSLYFRQYQNNAQGGLIVYFSDGSAAQWGVLDTDGQGLNNDTVRGQWHSRTVPLDGSNGNPSYVGKTLTTVLAVNDVAAPDGAFDMYFTDMAVVNGSTAAASAVFNAAPAQAVSSWSIFGGSSVTGVAAAIEAGTTDPSGGSAATTHYYLDDHLGTAQAELNAWGLPMWQGQFTPFGSELPDGTTTMHYKFTGKERDTESGLDYFGARYYASNMGRFMSPDSSGYSGLRNPQSWNLYAYTLNNPMRYVDPTGHTVECKTDAATCLSAAQGAVGKDAAGQLGTKTTQSWWQKHVTGGSTTTLTINGSEKDFRGASGNASKLADLIDSKTNFEVSIQKTADPSFSSLAGSILGGGSKFDLQGGAVTFTPSQGYDPAVFLDPRSAATVDTDSARDHIPPANLAEKFAHELLGHEWGEVFGGHPAGTAANKRDAINTENEVRRTDPTRGQKTAHHD